MVQAVGLAQSFVHGGDGAWQTEFFLLLIFYVSLLFIGKNMFRANSATIILSLI
jgi:hypothetical protein